MTKKFQPHAILETERRIPSPVWLAGVLGIETILRIDFDKKLPSATFLRQALKKLPEAVPAFGRVVGVTINYKPDFAVKYDLTGAPVEVLDQAKVCGVAYISTLH